MSEGIESVLRLTDFRVMKSYFEVQPQASTFDRSKLELALDIAVLQSNDSEDDMAVQLTVDLNRLEEQFKRTGFTGSLAVTGFFDAGDLKRERAEDWESALIFNAVTVLFGTVRTVYAELSAASPVGRIVVPTVNVADIMRAKAAEVADVAAD